MKARFQLRPLDYLGQAADKQRFNRALFAEVAPKYDFVTRALSLGRDRAWKRHLIAALPNWTTPVCLDLACGTGDITRSLAARYPDAQVTGLDLTPEMLAIAQGFESPPNVTYTEGSMQALPFADGSIDIVTGGYALRNAPDLDQALAEIVRVLRPGGVAAILDFSKPPSRLGQAMHHAILKTWGGFWGLVLHRNPDVYGYIADSLRLYPNRDELRARLAGRRLKLLKSRRFYAGVMEMLCFQKQDV